jgi:O-antigen/teichoic acid export membrane protein
MLRVLYQSPSLRAAVAFGFGGVTFTLGNLVLARILSSNEYGLLSLFIGVITVAGPSAPVGINHVIARRGLMLGANLRRTVLATCALIGLATVLICKALYNLEISMLLAVLVATIAMGILQSVNAHFQGQRQFGLSIPFTQISNWVLMPIGIIAWVCGITTATLPSFIIALATLIAAGVGWFMVARRTADGEPQLVPAGLWGQAISLMTINVAGSVLLQLERLIIPMTIGIENLALFGVAASLVGSPFRMLQTAINFTVIPRMRNAGSVAERRRLLRREFLLFGVVMGPASVALWLLAPPLAHLFLGGRYDLSTAIIVAMLVSGLLKVLSGFGSSVVSALASDKGLWLLSTASWISIALSVCLAFVFRPWGLSGAIYAVSVGWLVTTAVAFWISLPYLRNQAQVPV